MYTRTMFVEPLLDLPARLPSEPGPWRERDYFARPDDPRLELLTGRFFLNPAPRILHQLAVLALLRRLEPLRRSRHGLLLAAPVDVVLDERTVVQPDLCWVERSNPAWSLDVLRGAPDLVVEVLSPGSERRDRTIKRDLYLAAGVAEIWIVDLDARLVEIHRPVAGGGSQAIVTSVATGTLRSMRYSEIAVDLDGLWEELAEAGR